MPRLEKRIVFSTQHEKARGLIGMKGIPKDTAFIFTDVRPGQIFHSRGVLEPFEIAFFDKDGNKLSAQVVVPEAGTAQAPPGTVKAVECARGTLP